MVARRRTEPSSMLVIQQRVAPRAPAPSPISPSLIGLAALARKAMRGEDLGPVLRPLLARLAADPADAAAWMDLSTIAQLRGAGAQRVTLQTRALESQRVYRQPASGVARATLLALVAPGDFMANTPLEFLLEGADIDIVFLYVGPDLDLLAAAPDHDAAFVAVAESAANQPALAAIARVAERWPRPLLNAPQAIARLTRDGGWRLLRETPGLFYPRNERFSRDALAEGGRDETFPLIVRPVDSHAGEALEKIDDPDALAAYLDAHAQTDFYTAPFVDYRGADGLFRKMRIAVVDGEAFPVHLAISPRWMIHYLNADMAISAAHRAEEARFMENFAAFAQRHAQTFAAMREKLQLDYFLIDGAEIADGHLLIFEVGTAMIAHDLDCPKTYPYKSAPMRRLFDAFRRMVLRRAGATDPAPA
jgi:hypothetical protein